MYHKWQSYDVQFLRYGARQTDFFCHFELFLPFYPPNDPKNQNFEKMKKKWLEIISFTQLYQKSWSYVTLFMRYDVWGMWFLFFILGYFLPFYHPNNQKNQNFRKMIKHLEISSFHTCVPKIMITWCLVPETWSATDGQTDGRTDGKSDI